MLEMIEKYELNPESGRNRLTGWEPRDVGDIAEEDLREVDIRRDVFLPPFLRENLTALDKRYVFMLSRSGTMTRYFIKES